MISINKNLYIFILIYIFINQNVFAKDHVKILSWWGYINEQTLIDDIEIKCKTSLMIDEYYTNSEFIRRMDNFEYDIHIYSDTASQLTSRKLESDMPDIRYLTKSYNKHILKRFETEHRKLNTVFFALSGTVFVWNTSIIDPNTLYNLDVFKKRLSGSILILLDDPVEIYSLIEPNLTQELRNKISKSNKDPFGLDIFLKGMDVRISNNLISSSTGKPFALSYTWSGAAVDFYKIISESSNFKENTEYKNSHTRIQRLGAKGYPSYEQDSRNYDYTFHPNFSHISTDLLTLTNNKKSAKCVADQIGHGSKHLEVLNSTYYLSPTLAIPKNADKFYLDMYKKFMLIFPNMRWKKQVSNKQYQKLNTQWQKIRMDY